MVYKKKLQKLRGQQSIAIEDTSNDQENRDFQRMGWVEWREYSRKDGYVSNVKDSSSENGETAIQVRDAIHKGDTEMVKKLLEKGINIEKPKALAEQQRNTSICDLLSSYEMSRAEEEKLEETKGEKSNSGRAGKCHGNDSDHQHCSSSIQIKQFKRKDKRVTIHMLSQEKDRLERKNGKLIVLPSSIEELLRLAGQL